MKSFDEAARAAAVELEPRIDKLLASLCNTLKEAGFLPQNVCVDTYNEDAEGTVRFFNGVIAKHFAPLAEIYAKLVELATYLSIVYSAKEIHEKIDAITLMVPMLADPLVIAAIKRNGRR